jgi:hypothetical protein
LSIPRHLVAMMGGELGMSSEPSGGSTFWFTVPLGKASPPAVHSRLGLDIRVLLVDTEAATGTSRMQRMGCLACRRARRERSRLWSGCRANHRPWHTTR